jgi:RimJ/RimL family protein N-acetyltransferase
MTLSHKTGAHVTLNELRADLRAAIVMPKVVIDLAHHETEGNDPFFAKMVEDFHSRARMRHRKFPLIESFEWGVALCELPEAFEDYFMLVDGSARRNFKKARRLGYRVERISINPFLTDIQKIRTSAATRQGKRMPREYLADDVKPCTNPPSRTSVHDYPYFGVIGPQPQERVVAYAGCMVSGEVCMIEHILGHAEHQDDGVVPFLILEMARCVRSSFPRVRFYGYSSYFGAEPAMKRFKRKFHFMPHRVEWMLGEKAPGLAKPLVPDSPPQARPNPLSSDPCRLVFRQKRTERFALASRSDIEFEMISSPLEVWLHRTPLADRAGRLGAVKTALKTATGSRLFYWVSLEGKIVATGWCTVSHCRQYRIEPGEVVIGPIWTSDKLRGRGIATYALKRAMNGLMNRGHRVFYIDTTQDNDSCQRVIEKCGFGPPVLILPLHPASRAARTESPGGTAPTTARSSTLAASQSGGAADPG